MTSPQPEQTTDTILVQTSPTALGASSSKWKIRAGFVSAAVVAIAIALFAVNFFWHHWIAGFGMKSWASHAGASPIECMIKDTNSDGYVSCSAMLQGEVVPLECGASIFNIGCRVNYGAAAAPPVRTPTLPSGRS